MRGAAMVEAAIVISLLILGLMGLMFFRTFYIKQMLASRLARASILAYSMNGCERQEPLDWIGRKDRVNLRVGPPDSNREPAVGENQDQSASPSDPKTSRMMEGTDTLSADGRGVLNPVTNSDLSGLVTLNSEQGLLTPSKTVFSNPVHARSFVTCGEPRREGNVRGVLDSLMDKLKSL